MVEQSLHEAIRSGDVEARLVYRDWLEEQGREEEAALLRSGRWCLVPAGSFWMGGGGGKAGAKQVRIPHQFYLGAYPVTQGEWLEVMGKNFSWFSREGGGKNKVASISDEDLRQFPVETVSWDDVQVFLEKLNARRTKTSVLTYRLPTEEEWEYACRAARSSKTDCKYRFYLDKLSNQLSSTQANFNGNFPAGKAAKGPYLGRTSKVGSYPPNNLGIHDVHGNVCEWTATLQGSGRVYRGGSWIDAGKVCSAAYRNWLEPSIARSSLGCRLLAVPVRL
jgi:uncharacterized protein (TIGR02996 family)